MKKNTNKKWLSLFLVFVLAIATCLSGCGKKKGNEDVQTPQDADTTSEVELQVPETQNFIELAINVYYNDNDHDYFTNDAGESIYVTEEGQYTLTFDCETDLSEEAKSAGVSSLSNLTAVYILDMGSTKGAQSPIKACNIKYDSVVVDGTELTVTQDSPKKAVKASGVFDTNDPINAWDGSAVEEVASTSEHVANFTTVKDPKTISITFTLSDMNWDGEETVEEITTSANKYVNTAVFSNVDFSEMNSVEFTKYLGNGINLGNTMEAFNTAYGKDLDVSTYEQAWGQPITTKEMIVGMKNCGFDTLRIPVAWTNMMDYENGNFTIATEYVDRVQEIVDWALEAEMFVIVNDHYDGGWWDLFAGDADEQEVAWTIYEEMWTQICDRFKDYSDMLILESANEELGSGWIAKSMEEDDTYTLMNEINQKFVDIVRASGGNNENRFLLIAGNNTNIDKTIDSRFKMPKDTKDGKLLVSVHYYDPWNYCGDKEADSPDKVESYKWGLASEYEYSVEQLGKMSQFVDAGYGVIIGEYGALPCWIDGKSYQLPNTVEYTSQLLSVCDVDGFCPILWSTGNSYNKTTLTMISDELTELFTSRCYAEEVAAGDAYLEDVKANMEAAAAEAPDHWEGQEVYEPGTPVAWIMWNGGAGTYSVGDVFNAADCTEGITANNVVIDGAGEYEVSLDFAGTNDGITFAALGIADAEVLYPGGIIKIIEISVDGNPLKLTAVPYTSSDDQICTRVNLYNMWVNKAPDDARTWTGQKEGISPMIIDPADLVGIKNITVKFEFITE